MTDVPGTGVTLGNAELGLILTFFAGMSTTIGAAAVYNKQLVQLASKRVLAAGLGL